MRAFISRIVVSTWVVFVLTVVATQAAQAQMFNVVHDFTGGADGGDPAATLTLDKAGNLYGTTFSGGQPGCSPQTSCGTAFKMAHKNSAWLFEPLYSFSGGTDGANPDGRLVIDANGTFYGPTFGGGVVGCTFFCGTVFNLRPQPRAPASVFAPWLEKVLYVFTDPAGAPEPQGDLIFDQQGNLYGTATGAAGPGDVYELSPSGSSWIHTVLHNFGGTGDGFLPYGGVVFDKAGNLYGTTSFSSMGGGGTVFQLVPSGANWTENILYDFSSGTNGIRPQGALIMDPSGNLYGTTSYRGPGGGGTVFELSPSGGSWVFATLYGFTGSGGPLSSLTMDSAGNLYGTTSADGAHNLGSVFKLTLSNGSWHYASLHDFSGSDGSNPSGGVTLDANGNLYGTTTAGGAHGFGVVWEITP
jgi:uncharacterized repeat protein (TIGR03803 family)